MNKALDIDAFKEVLPMKFVFGLYSGDVTIGDTFVPNHILIIHLQRSSD